MKTALITGIGRGIGKALEDKFTREGYSVIGTTQNEGLYRMDLSSPASITKCAADIAASGTKIDILIDNAGALFDGEDTVLDADKLRKTLEVNTIGTADFTERMLPCMNEGSHIVFISSLAGSITDMDDVVGTSHHPYYYPAYKISKAALNMYARTLAARLSHEKHDITVSCVHPGWVSTDMGGSEAPTSPTEAAADIFKLAISKPATGHFWHKGQECPW